MNIEGVGCHIVPVSEKTAWVVLRLDLEGGGQGYGEATYFGQELAVKREIDGLNSRIKKGRVASFSDALSLLAQAEPSCVRVRVRSALEQALYDGLARSCNLSISNMVGGGYQKSLKCYANINRGISDRSPKGFVNAAKKAVLEGYTAIKIAPFDCYRWQKGIGKENTSAYQEGLKRIDYVKNEVGENIELLVDCHSKFNVFGAYNLIEDLAGLNIFWLEDIVDYMKYDAETLRGIREKANTKGIRIAGGEQLTNIAEASSFLCKESVDVILPDLRLTGIKGGISILQLASEKGIYPSLHNPVGPILDAVSQQVSDTVPEFLMLERQFDESDIFEIIKGERQKVFSGKIDISDKPGFGFRVDEELLAELSKEKNIMLTNFDKIAGAGPDA